MKTLAAEAYAAETLLDLEDPMVIEAIEDLAGTPSWRVADRAIARLGFAGELIERPHARGLSLPCAPHARPGQWGANWVLPNAQVVAERLLERAPAQPTSGNGWTLLHENLLTLRGLFGPGQK